ncbi:MAG TPA: UDP-N-acetylmuramate dehydrogenase [Terriglobales bacterium]|nr:UDP-N-acetylmuramate dehydrogenase [Terriglobales bacterium]
MIIGENVPLAPLTTLGVGGPARYFTEAQSEADAIEAVEFARSHGLSLFVLGGGSNLVVADAGFGGLVLKIAIGGVTCVEATDGTTTFAAGAGCDWDTLVAQTVAENCAGVECLSGIPGTAGATPVQNVGAYGQEVSSTIREVHVLDLQSMEISALSNEQCGFAYRSSVFNTSQRGRYIILRVSFQLRAGGAPTVRYTDLERFFAGRSNDATLRGVREAVRQIRHRKAMLIMEGDPDAHSVGSFFKNPIVPQSVVAEWARKAASRGMQLPSYPANDGFRKVPAAWLVEHAGFNKGYVKGGAGISRKHALAIINRGAATAEEIIALKAEIQSQVQDAFGMTLEPEPVFVGF